MKRQKKIFVLILFTIVLVLSGANAVHAVGVVGTITGIGAGMVAYDFGKGEIFVSNNANNTVSVISDSTNTVISTIPVGTIPEGVAYDAGKGEIFVTNLGSNTVSIISDSSGASVSPTPSSSVSPTPTVPEFNTETLILVLLVMVVVSFCIVASALKKVKPTIPNSKQ